MTIVTGRSEDDGSPAPAPRWKPLPIRPSSTAEVQAEQPRAKSDLQRAWQAYRPPRTREELGRVISDTGDLLNLLANADPIAPRAWIANTADDGRELHAGRALSHGCRAQMVSSCW